ncbi:MAG: ThuA domain-containing protein [Sphingobacteriaceae bacterium]|nr:ThuA domain-containing protein [Sphingobacteriaceae bacterium]
MKFFYSVSLLLYCSFALAQKPKLIDVLIVDGFSNHNWKQTTKVATGILEGSGLFKVSVSTLPLDSAGRENWDPGFEKYAVVIQNTNNIQNKNLKWPRNAEKHLESYVRSGGGLYILHSANNAFAHWAEYDKMIGLGWRPKETGYALEINAKREVVRIPPGEGRNTSHGKRFDALIQILNRHPINKGFPNEWKTPSMEVYTYPRGPAQNLTVLSFAYDSVSTQKTFPVEWIVKYGKGRVYNSSMGHLWKDEIYPISYRCVGFQTTMIRVAEWLAKGKVTYPVPPNFPGKDNISVVGE